MDPYDGKGSFNSHNKELKLQSLQQLKNLKNELNSIAVTWDLRDYEKRLQVSSGCHMIWLQKCRYQGSAS